MISYRIAMALSILLFVSACSEEDSTAPDKSDGRFVFHAGKYDDSLYYGGFAPGRAECPNAGMLSGNSFTYEAWINEDVWVNGTQWNRCIFQRGEQSSDASLVNLYLDFPFIAVGYNDSGHYRYYHSKTALSLKTWYHVAATYDGNVLSLYINGNPDTSYVLHGMVSESNSLFYIAGLPEWKNFFWGMLDELRIWNICRSPVEIVQNMHAELSGNESGLVGYWNFNGNVNDSSPMNQHGTLFGSYEYLEQNY